MRKYIILFLLSLSIYSDAFTQIHSISGNLINGLGTVEKLERVRISFYAEKEFIGGAYTDSSGYFRYTQTVDVTRKTDQPSQFQLLQNYPNPFYGSTTISYESNGSASIQVAIYNILGQKVCALYEGLQAPGVHQLIWDGLDEGNNKCTMGTYFIVMKTGRTTYVRKICLLGDYNLQISKVQTHPHHILSMNDVTDLTVQISDRDLVDTTFTFVYDTEMHDLELGQIVVHVHPFVRPSTKTKTLMFGESIRDTIEIYHEKPVELTSQNAIIEWEFMNGDSISMLIHNVESGSIYLRLNEVGSSHITYYVLIYELEPRLTIDRDRFKRGYLNIPYDDLALLRNSRGDATIRLISELPQQLSFGNFRLSGNPIELFDDYLHFDLLDGRNILVPDSVYLSIREPVNINFNEYTIDILEEYPRDGTHPYSWVNTYTGVTRNLYYKGELIATANPDGSKSCYCCGLTFENFFRSIQRLLSDLDQGEEVNLMSVADMKYFLYLWFVERVWGDGPGVALERFGLGDIIEKRADVKKGDYVQFWRTTGSGHSVVFIDWLISTSGDTVGIKYWSTQSSTNGINFSSEYFDGFGGTVNPAIVYFSRVRSPENFEPFNKSLFDNYDEITSEDYIIRPRNYMKN